MEGTYEGNEVAIKVLQSSVRSGRVAHAYLLKGPQSSVKDRLATAFARGLLCDNPETESTDLFGCGHCWSCREIDRSGHPDYYAIEKEGSSIKIKASHDILKEALSKPYHSKRKVFVVKDADDMTLEASNALLKILEEPPEYVTFILTSSNVAAIPETIVSRCQVVLVKRMPPRALTKELVEEYGADPALAEAAVQYADGIKERALWLLSEGARGIAKGAEYLREVIESSPVDLAWRYSREDPDSRRRMVLALQIELSNRFRESLGEGYQGPTADPRVLLRALRSCREAKQRIDTTVNSFLTLTTLFLDLKRVLSTK